MPHRNDIDGLRAIAVLAVVLFHFGFSEWLGGGFVGVDVFFVISGYLITGILQTEIDGGRLSILEFYHRRVRRIFPALFVVHLFCIAAATYLLFPSEAKEVGRDVLWSLAFLSNVTFSHAEGYFDHSSQVDPLLHTWSLSVEEQFYVGLPLLLLLLARVGRKARIGVLAALALASLVLSEKAVGDDARAAFFLVQYRAWELLAGSLLALGAFGRVRSRALAEGLGAIGVALILTAIVWFGETTPFPGFRALLPCVGAVLVLHSGQEVQTLTARLLGATPLRLIGAVSYSLYLWHWPVLALYNVRHPQMPWRDRLLLLAFTVAASILSYRYVERPFRQKPYRHGSRAALGFAALGMTFIAALAIGVPVAGAALRPHLKLADEALVFLKHHPSPIRTGTCFLNDGFDDVAHFRKDICLKVMPDRRNFLVMGDSHAAHLTPAFAASRPDINVMQATATGCQALWKARGGPARCRKLFAYVFDEFLPAQRVDTVVLAGHWPGGDVKALKKTVEHVLRYADRVVVLGPVVEYDQAVPRLLARSIAEKDEKLPAEHLLKKPRSLDKALERGLRTSGAEYFSVHEATCPDGKCTLWAAPGVPMQFDRNHLTLLGGQLVLKRMGPRLWADPKASGNGDGGRP